MKLPRDVGGAELAKALANTGYRVTRQSGSHLRLTHPGPPQHHVTIPGHSNLKVGTLAGILDEVAKYLGLDRDALLKLMFP